MIKSKKLLKSSATAHEEVDGEGTWALSYGDMITLLLSFFVIYFSTDPKRDKMLQSNSLMSFSLEGKESSPSEPKTEGAQWKQDLEDLKLHAQIVGEHVVVTFDNLSFFESGTTIVNEKAKAALEAFSTKYLPYSGKYHLAIKGFTDRRPVSQKRGRLFADNLELSALRSIASMRVLQKSGIPLNRMEIAGAGELEDISKVLPSTAKLTPLEIETMSRTIVLVLKPEKASF